ncbi:expressed unknown protein [Seminavis robusta]|uniref:Uncharacterized protein n=1 Tax=Seminavis robusta TaxID=568900 RepID=A0A9N8EPE2_9STRA|nr:expressed unknown protein [Seminavis robusta]|eukprot:Sro1446_g273480.1 n/a (198) ;mRNA; r:19925-20595
MSTVALPVNYVVLVPKDHVQNRLDDVSDLDHSISSCSWVERHSVHQRRTWPHASRRGYTDKNIPPQRVRKLDAEPSFRRSLTPDSDDSRRTLAPKAPKRKQSIAPPNEEELEELARMFADEEESLSDDECEEDALWVGEGAGQCLEAGACFESSVAIERLRLLLTPVTHQKRVKADTFPTRPARRYSVKLMASRPLD